MENKSHCETLKCLYASRDSKGKFFCSDPNEYVNASGDDVCGRRDDAIPKEQWLKKGNMNKETQDKIKDIEKFVKEVRKIRDEGEIIANIQTAYLGDVPFLLKVITAPLSTIDIQIGRKQSPAIDEGKLEKILKQDSPLLHPIIIHRIVLGLVRTQNEWLKEGGK